VTVYNLIIMKINIAFPGDEDLNEENKRKISFLYKKNKRI